MIVRVQSAELSSVQRFVLRLIGDWGAGSDRVGGVALLGAPLPRPRRRSTTAIDLLIWTPYGCTLVVLADFGSVQHGVLETPEAGRWQVGEGVADLRTGAGTANPLLRARRQRAELAAILRRHGVPEQIDVLVVLIPKTGSRITWDRPPQQPGEEMIMVRIGQSADFTEYFEHPAGGPVCWRAADLTKVFTALGIPLSVPDPAESAAEGFEVTAADTVIGAPVPADSAAGRLRKPGFPLFGSSRRRSTPPDIPAEFAGERGHGPIGRASHAGVVPGAGSAGPWGEGAFHEVGAWADPAATGRPGTQQTPGNSGAPDADRHSGQAAGPPGSRPAGLSARRAGAVDRTDRPSAASSADVRAADTRAGTGSQEQADIQRGRPGAPMAERSDRPASAGPVPVVGHEGAAYARSEPGSQRQAESRHGRPEAPAAQPPRRPASARFVPVAGDEGAANALSERGRQQQPGTRQGRDVDSVPESPEWEQRAAAPPLYPGTADTVLDEDGHRLRAAGRSPEYTSGSPSAAVDGGRARRQIGVAGVRGLRERLLRTAAGAAEDSSSTTSAVTGEVPGSPREEDPPVMAGTAGIGGEDARPEVTIDGPGPWPGMPSPGQGIGKPARVPAGVRRGFAGLRQVSDRMQVRAMVARPAGRPQDPEYPGSVPDPRGVKPGSATGVRARAHARPATGARAGGPGWPASGSYTSGSGESAAVPGQSEPVAGASGSATGEPGKGAGGGGRARYAAVLGAAGAVLAVVAGTVFAASGFARFEVAEYGALCHGGGGTAVAAPYSVAGPSPVHLAGKLADTTTFGPSAVWHPVDAGSVQLVACVSEGQLGALLRTCQYRPAPGHPVGRTLNLFTMRYQLDVYEARTGSRLATIDLVGEQFAADPARTEPDECRAAAGAPEEGLPGRRHSRLSHQQVQQALAPFVTPATPHVRAAR